MFKWIAQLNNNININLKISRRVNANASPDVAKPLYQREGGCASFPLIQSFACTDSARALRRTGSARALRRHNLEGQYVLELTFYCLFKLQYSTKLGKIEEKYQFPRELIVVVFHFFIEVIPKKTSSGGVVRIRINFLLSF